jgi:uncharacterized protein (DUF885 family)
VSLKNYTTSTMTPDEIHQLGLDLVTSISAEADKLFKTMGMTKGTVGERMAELGKDIYPNTDAAKEQLIADLNTKAKWIEKQLPAYFGQLPKAPLEIRRVPKAIEAGAPGGYYNSPSLDGKRPGIYWINLRDTKEQAKYTLTTLTVHEGVPGHHLQLSISNEAQGLPLIRKVVGFSGYAEGWALYSEQLAVEMGIYKTDPRGHIGMLHDALFRAVRLVVDSGMHHKKWSREQAVKYMAETMGDEESGSITEIERYCRVAGPGLQLHDRQDHLAAGARAGQEGPGQEVRHPQVPRRGPAVGHDAADRAGQGGRQLHRRQRRQDLRSCRPVKGGEGGLSK